MRPWTLTSRTCMCAFHRTRRMSVLFGAQKQTGTTWSITRTSTAQNRRRVMITSCLRDDFGAGRAVYQTLGTYSRSLARRMGQCFRLQTEIWKKTDKRCACSSEELLRGQGHLCANYRSKAKPTDMTSFAFSGIPD